jgi:hypothetical protein
MKTIEQILIEQLGGLTMTIAKVESENSKLRDRVAELEAEKQKHDLAAFTGTAGKA